MTKYKYPHRQSSTVPPAEHVVQLGLTAGAKLQFSPVALEPSSSYFAKKGRKKGVGIFANFPTLKHAETRRLPGVLEWSVLDSLRGVFCHKKQAVRCRKMSDTFKKNIPKTAVFQIHICTTLDFMEGLHRNVGGSTPPPLAVPKPRLGSVFLAGAEASVFWSTNMCRADIKSNDHIIYNII